MALIVEDGTGLTDSEVYLSVIEADEYHAKRNNTLWAALTQVEKEAALIKGADYLSQVYRNRWAGYRTSAIQSMDWPRAYVLRDSSIDNENYIDVLPNAVKVYYPQDFIPKEVKYANAELALRSLEEDLNVETERLTTQEKVGSIAVSYDKNARDRRIYPMVEGFLRPFLRAGGQARLVRG